MFSSRLQWDAHPNRFSTLLESKKRTGAAVLDLTESNPTRAGLAYPAREILDALSDPGSLVYDPRPAGLEGAREAVAGHYRSRGCNVPPERILLTASTSEAYAHLFKLLADPGDEILAPCPSYPLFEFLAALESVRIVPYPLAYHGLWSIDFDAIERSLTSRTRAIVLVNPNNPTGSFIKQDELARLAALASSRGVALISDEVFADYAFVADAARVPTLAAVTDALAFCLSGVSKICGLPQMKLGWVAAAGPGSAEALARLEWISDTFLSVGTPVQHALPRLLQAGEAVRAQISQRTRANLEWLRGAIGGESTCQLLDVEGGWYATLRIPRTRSEEEWALALLERENVLVQPGYFYDFGSEAYLVLSLLTPAEAFREGIARLLTTVACG